MIPENPPPLPSGIPLDGKPVDLPLLMTELQTAGIPVVSCGISGDLLMMHDAENRFIEPTPEAEAVVAAHDGTKKQRTAAFEEQEDAERLRIVTERAAEDPAYAALAELTLGKQGVTT